jgi:hypothetical protein
MEPTLFKVDSGSWPSRDQANRLMRQGAHMNYAEQFAEKYLRAHDLRPERFSKAEKRQGKTPDFRVCRGNAVVLYCEAKHVQRDQWLHRQLREAQPLELVGGLRLDPIFNRVSNHIHEAAQQFNAVNSDRAYPNLLVFANSDRQCGAEDLRSIMTGNFYAQGGAIEPIYTQYSEGRIRNEKFLIDAYIWWDDWKPTEKFTRFLWANSSHKETIKALLPREV